MTDEPTASFPPVDSMLLHTFILHCLDGDADEDADADEDGDADEDSDADEDADADKDGDAGDDLKMVAPSIEC